MKTHVVPLFICLLWLLSLILQTTRGADALTIFFWIAWAVTTFFAARIYFKAAK
ncbi:MAG: hypothetical protein Q4P66_00230 [Actinomycetaceae bacterium]|nr:hypothetical protein [Actinomycetaceae bacterium]